MEDQELDTLERKVKEELEKTETIKEKPKHFFLTSHLRGFKEIDRITRIHSSAYIPIKKCLWYQLMSLPLRTKTIEIGDLSTDCRIHAAYPLPSGSAKKNLAYTIKKVTEAYWLSFTLPTSHHPEQLIGRVIKKGKSTAKYEHIKGHLADDVVVFDEGIDIVKSNQENYREIRKYLNIAMDKFGENEIVKRMVDCPREESLRYFPWCTISLFFQPYFLPEEVVTIGSFRRFLVPYVPVKEDIDINDYENRLDGNAETTMNVAIDNFVGLLRKMRDLGKNGFVFVPEAVKRIKELHVELISQGFSMSNKCKNFTLMYAFTLQDIFVKMCVIQAASKGKEIVEPLDVEIAFMDLMEFFSLMLDFIEKKIHGDLDYGETWSGAINKDRECLEELFEKGATSQETSTVRISDYWDIIAEIYGKGEEMAKKIYYRHKDSKWIDSDQVGQHSSAVWLLVNPEVQGTKDSKDNNNASFQETEYYKICEKIKNTVANYNPYNPSNPEVIIKEDQSKDRFIEDIIPSSGSKCWLPAHYSRSAVCRYFDDIYKKLVYGCEECKNNLQKRQT